MGGFFVRPWACSSPSGKTPRKHDLKWLFGQCVLRFQWWWWNGRIDGVLDPFHDLALQTNFIQAPILALAMRIIGIFLPLLPSSFSYFSWWQSSSLIKLLQLPHHYLHADNINDTTYGDELTVSVSLYIVDYYRNFRGVNTMKLQ